MPNINGFNVNQDISGQKFYRLLAIKPVEILRNRNIGWEFLCDCGNIAIKVPADVKRGHTKSCGCLYKESRKWGYKSKGEAALNKIYYQYKKRSKGVFGFTKNEFQEITQQDCYYCGIKPNQEVRVQSDSGSYFYNGIDRVDNSKGYTKENSVPCCWKCNKAKHNMTEKEFLTWISSVYNHKFGI
jgi:hypothetical protein